MTELLIGSTDVKFLQWGGLVGGIEQSRVDHYVQLDREKLQIVGGAANSKLNLLRPQRSPDDLRLGHIGLRGRQRGLILMAATPAAGKRSYNWKTQGTREQYLELSGDRDLLGGRLTRIPRDSIATLLGTVSIALTHKAENGSFAGGLGVPCLVLCLPEHMVNQWLCPECARPTLV